MLGKQASMMAARTASVPMQKCYITSIPSRKAGAQLKRRDLVACRNGSNDEPASSLAAAVGGEAAAASNAAAATAAAAGTAAAPAAALATLRSAAPVDRLRYQALLIFDHFDADADGRLLPSELSAFLNYAGRKLMWSPGLSDVLARVRGECLGSLPPGGACSRERFLQLVRDQVHAVSCSPEYQRNELRPDAAARLQAQIGIPLQEICAAKWVFTLLDFDADGKVALADLDKAEGIERYYVDASLQDADEDEDGAIVFEEFLVSYAKPKPVWKNLIIMAANTLAIFLLLQSPLDMALKAVCVVALFVRPQIISRPASLVYDAIAALAGGVRARAELAKGGGGGSDGSGGGTRPSVWRAA